MDSNKERALIIVPHPDDEINIAGQLILLLRKINVEVFVAYTTNGDFNKKIGNKRLHEAIEALDVLGVGEDHIIFLGYANELVGKNNIYDKDKEGTVLVSKSGREKTSAIENHDEFSFQIFEEHHSFTRKNFKDDLKTLILTYKAKYLICNDYDSHPDHRATSLMFEEVVGEILKEDHTYRPIVLKKFAYSGVWKGSKAYYSNPMVITNNTIHGNIYGVEYETESPYYEWNERICFLAPEETRTILLRDNILFKAAKKHKSQIAWYQMLRIANRDVVYWWRPTFNLMLDADIHVSSGDGKFLNDFKLYESSNVNNELDSENEEIYAWIPDLTDKENTIDVKFNEVTNVKMLKLFLDYNPNNYVEKIVIKSFEGQEYIFNNEDINKTTWNLFLDLKNTTGVHIVFLQWKGKLAITEIEIYDHIIDFKADSNIQLEMCNEQSVCGTGPKISQRIEMVWLNICLVFKYKLKQFLRTAVIRGNTDD